MALILVPQSLAYARVAGLPAYVGLYAAGLPPLAAAFFVSSPYLQTGPSAVKAMLTAGALSLVAVAGTPNYIAYAAFLAFLVGVIRLSIGLLRLGNVAYLISEPVLRGFVTGAALLIIAAQIPAVLGAHVSGNGLEGLVRVLAHPASWNGYAVAFGVATLVLTLLLRWVHPAIPGALIATIGAILVSRGSHYSGPVVGTVPQGLPHLSLAFPWMAGPSLFLGAVVIALVGFVEAATIARVFAARERQRWDPDQDFVSQGVANLASAVAGGFPVGASFSRSTLGHMLGGRSRWAGAITGLAVLVFMPVSNVLAPLPIAVLGAIVIAAVFSLVRFRPLLALWRYSKPQFAVANGTLFLTLALAPHIEHAVLLGIGLAVALHLWREFRVDNVSWLEGTTLHLRPQGILWFGSSEILKQSALDLIADHRDVSNVVLHMEQLGRVDLTAACAVQSLVKDLQEAGIGVCLDGVKEHTAPALRMVLGEINARVEGDCHGWAEQQAADGAARHRPLGQT
jgi:sulfate permease, SulP family